MPNIQTGTSSKARSKMDIFDHEPLSAGTISPTTPMSTESSAIPFGTVLVVGGCGFLGHHIVKRLLKEETCESIHVMCRSPFKNRFQSVTYHIGDVTKAHHVDLIMSQVRPTVVINTASPHAYIDHEHAYQYFTVNVDGNKNLLAAMADVGTVRAYVYTSSGPIIAVPGGGYSLATEEAETLAWPTVKKGDPYHLAKALGDKLVLGASGKMGFVTATIRPTALYGEGDYQMVEPVIRVLDENQTNIWLGYNDIDMDVVYVGHVAEAHLLAVKGLLRGLVDPRAPRVAGEAFNITDDQPCYPWTFFRKYWVFAGDTTPLNSIIYIHPKVVLWMSIIAEWWAWSSSWGKKRPSRLKLERMEFALFTRTYSIQKIRERLGFEPWLTQQYSSQDEAVKGALDWWLLPENHGPVKPQNFSQPETPFKLISQTGIKSKLSIPADHYCIRAAQIMAMTHNTIFRALNAIYQQAPLLTGASQSDVSDFLNYCSVTYDFIHHHQLSEELIYFPGIEEAAGLPGLMSGSLQQHKDMDAGLERFRKYCESTPRNAFNGEELRKVIDGFRHAFEKHNHEEIGCILNLHDKIDSEALRKVEEAMRLDAEKNADMFKVAPFVLSSQDKNFTLDDELHTFPLNPWPVLVFVRKVLAPRHQNVWRFGPSDLYGRSRHYVQNIGKVTEVLEKVKKDDEEILTGTNSSWRDPQNLRPFLTILMVLIALALRRF